MEKTIIKITPEIRKKIFKVHGCTYPTIRTALDGRANTELAVRIRQTAIKNGGKVYKIQ